MPIPDVDDDLFDAPQPKKAAGNKIVHQPAGVQWSLSRLPEVETAYQASFKKKLPLTNRGQGGIHNKWGYDHRNSADVHINPSTPEGQQFTEQLKKMNVPFLAFTGAIPGVATGPHIHIGFPSHRTSKRFNIGAQRKDAALASDDLFDPPNQKPAKVSAPISDDDLFDAPAAKKPSPFARVKAGLKGESPQTIEAGEGSSTRSGLFPNTSPSMQARKPGIVERAKEAIAPYVPGLTSIDTPMGIKTDALRGAIRGATLGIAGDSREITPEEMIANPNAEADRNARELGGETIGAVVPYVGAGKLLSAVPALNRATRTAHVAKTAATFGGVDLARQGVEKIRHDTPFDPKEAAISTAIGAAIGGIAGVDPSLKRQIVAFVAPQVAVDAARGTPVEQAAQSAVTNFLFGLHSGAAPKRLTAKRIGEIREQLRGQAPPERPETVSAQLDAVKQGTRPTVLIAPGTQRPSLPRGMRAEKTAEGIFYYDPQQVSRETIRQKVADGTHGELLGHVEPKSAATTETVVARDAQGKEIQSSAVSPEKLPAQAEVMAEQYPEAKIEIGDAKLAEKVLDERATPQRFHSLRFGDVVVTMSQEGARAGKLRVAEVNNPEAIHYVKKADLQGRGNAQLLPIKESASQPVDIPVESAETRSQETAPQAQSTVSPAFQGKTINLEDPVPADVLRIINSTFNKTVGPDIYSELPKNPKTQDVIDLLANVGLSDQIMQQSTPALRKAGYSRIGDVMITEEGLKFAPKELPPAQIERPSTKQVAAPTVDRTATKGASVQGETAPAPSTTSARKAQMADDRAALDLPELPISERKSWQRTLDEAKAKGTQNAGILADEVLARPRALNDVETGQLVLRAQEVKNEHSQVMREIGDAKDPHVIETKRAEAEALEREFDRLSQATKASGSEKGRALASQKLTINQDFDLVSMIQRAKAARGRELQPEERAKIETQAKEIEELTAKLADAEERVKSAQLQKEIDRIVRRGRRVETKAALDDEFAALKAQFAKAKAEIPRVQAAGLASLDPEGVLTKLIVKMAQNRVRAGTVQAESLVDEVYSAVREHVEGITKRDVRDAISGYGMEPKGDRRSEPAKQLADIRGELKQLSAQEDIAAGKRLPPKDKTRQTVLLKQEAELQRRLEQKDFSPSPKREPPKYTRETYEIQKRLDRVKADYEKELYRATRGTTGRLMDEASKIGNVPKTIKSMGDISAVFRQGGFYAITHPVKGLAVPFRDMIRSFSDMGYRNVENAIKSRPKFEQAKKDGIEFTGVDKNDPRLSRHEEGYLGSEYLDYIPVAKQIKDFSERTFVSFLDSQRMSMYETLTEGLANPSRLKRLLGAKSGLSETELTSDRKRIAQAINSATGRGNLGPKGNAAAPLLNIAMFSPRLLKSRVELLNNMLNPAAIARMPRNARAEIISDNVKFLAGTVAVLGLAKAAGATVNDDSDDADFLKIRFGNTTYDTLTGLQQPFRFLINMSRAVKADVTGDETYAGQTKGELSYRFARSKLSPVAGAVETYRTGKDFEGREFSAKRTAKDLLMPLPANDVIEAMKEEGLIGGLKATPTFVGIGINTYPERPDTPRTHAEKLARKFARARMPDNTRTSEQVDLDQTKADLRAKSRRGEDVTKELEALGAKITDKQAKNILNARGKTRLEEDMNGLSANDAIIVWSVMSPGQQVRTRSILEHKATLIDNLPEEQQLAVRQRYAAAGIEAKSKEKKSGFKTAFTKGLGAQRRVNPFRNRLGAL